MDNIRIKYLHYSDKKELNRFFKRAKLSFNKEVNNLLNILFYLFLEIQVRCEEDYLFSLHGEQYSDYKKRTKRYLPLIY